MDTRVYDFKGEVYDSINAMCRAYGITPSTYRKRVMRGATMEEALTKSIQKHDGSPILCQRESTNSKMENYCSNWESDEERALREKRKERELAKQRAYNQTRRQLNSEYQKKYREAHKQEIREYHKKRYRETKQSQMGMSEKRTMNQLQAWLKIKEIIDSQFDADKEAFNKKNFEQILICFADINLQNMISCSYFLWKRANNYFDELQRLNVVDILFEDYES